MKSKLPVAVLFVVIALAGVGAGFGVKMMAAKKTSSTDEVVGAPGTIKADQISVNKLYGVEDAKKFPDVSVGVVEKGGMDGEGSHHLVRPGGKSQTVYMTSSTVDLDLFVGDKVEVKGETFAAQKAAWFMDVGSVKVLELNAAPPASPAAIPAGE